MFKFFSKYCLQVSFVLCMSFTIWLAGNLGGFGLNKITFDVISYHAYTPAVFIKKDISLKFFKENRQDYTDKGMYWANIAPNGNAVIKTTYGLSLMNLPFTVWPLLFYTPPNLTGYELPFSMAICTATLFYAIMSVVLVIRLLKQLHFSNRAIAGSIYVLTIGTNFIVYSSICVGVAHIYDFFLLIAMLNLITSWHQKKALWQCFLIGLVFGMLILNRPTNIIFSFAILFFGNTFYATKNQFFSWQNMFQLLLMAIMAFIVILPQLLYWKFTSGHYIFNSYIGENFFFNKPHIIDYLFGFRKGWFIYSPLILIAFYGLFIHKSKNPFFIVTLICVPLLVFINSSWWCWWFGGGYSARAMIETYPLLVIGMAAFFEHFLTLKKKLTIWLTAFFILFNIKCVDLYRANIIHYDSMNFKTFVYTTFKINFSHQEKNYLKTIYSYPDYEAAKKGVSP